jgi:hypothetical protein
METRQLIPLHISDRPEFREIGENMMSIWEKGVGEFCPANSFCSAILDKSKGTG